MTLVAERNLEILIVWLPPCRALTLSLKDCLISTGCKEHNQAESRMKWRALRMGTSMSKWNISTCPREGLAMLFTEGFPRSGWPIYVIRLQTLTGKWELCKAKVGKQYTKCEPSSNLRNARTFDTHPLLMSSSCWCSLIASDVTRSASPISVTRARCTDRSGYVVVQLLQTNNYFTYTSLVIFG